MAGSATVKIGGQALADGVLMRTSRAWAIARADGSVEVGATPPNWAVRLPVLRIVVGLGGALQLAISRGMLRRGSHGAGVGHSRRLNRRFLWVVLGLEGATAAFSWAAAPDSVRGAGHLVLIVLPWLVTLAVLRLATPAALWRYHGAEHKAVTAHETGVDLADTEAVLACTRVHNRCGTNLVAVMVVAGLLLSRLPGLVQVPAFVLLLAAVAELVSLAASRPRALPSRLLLVGGRALQRYVTTAEPTADEQAVGCVALTACLVEHARVETPDAANVREGIPALAA